MNDLALYDRHAADWWDRDSPFAAALHDLNRLRLAEIAAQVGPDFAGIAVDFGCGGGLIANPLALRGARVLAFDLSLASLRAASAQAARARHDAARAAPAADRQRLPACTPARIPAVAQGDVRRAPIATGCADLVLCADVLEHVPDWRAALAEAARVARPGAWAYIDTINRTRRARYLAVGLAEGLRLIPRGTHDHRMFVRPDELAAAGAACGWRLERVMGRSLRVWATLADRRLRLAPGSGVWGSYGAWLRRVPACGSATDVHHAGSPPGNARETHGRRGLRVSGG